MGVSYNEYKQDKKLEKAKRLLKKSDDKVINIALAEVGYLEKSKIAFKKNPDVIYDKRY